MKILAIIPARGGSKRVPRKNIKMIKGKPLIAYTVEEAFNSNYINKIVVSTEDKEIADVSKSLGVQVVKRPIELASDEAKTPPVMLHVLEELKETEGYVPDIVILLQATVPFRTAGMVDVGIEKLLNSDNDSVFSVYEVSKTLFCWINDNGKPKALYDYHLRPRTQEVEIHEPVYKEDGSFYAIKTDAMIKHQDIIGEKPAMFINDEHIDIDHKEDFEKAENFVG